MIKDLLVNLSVAPIRDVAGDFALSIGAAFGAHVAGVAYVYEPAPPVLTMGNIPVEVLGELREENAAAAAASIEAFDSAARRAGVSAERHAVDTTFLGAPDHFARLARRFDLAVVGQAEPGRVAPEELIAEAALFDSGRPVVVVPYIQRTGLGLDRVMVCWDGGRNAARAIGDAVPLLARAGRIDVVIVARAAAKGDEIPGADIAQHLARHGVSVEVRRIVSPEVDVAGTILSHAADTSADFIVMGGYGHSRLREFILGGATRGILAAMTVPTLLSH